MLHGINSNLAGAMCSQYSRLCFPPPRPTYLLHAPYFHLPIHTWKPKDHRQTVQTQIRRHMIWRLIRVTVFDNRIFHKKNRIKATKRPDSPKMTSGFVQHMIVEESTSIQWIKLTESCDCSLLWYSLFHLCPVGSPTFMS